MKLSLTTPYQNDLFDYNQKSLYFPRPKTVDELAQIVLKDGRIPRHFQAENIHFLENKAGFRGCIADDTGLGKTISTCATILEFKDQLLPCLIVCKTTLKVQWFIELISSTDIVAQVIGSSADWINEDAQAWIISYDLLKRIDASQLSPKLVVLDEAQLIKNWDSARTQALLKFVEGIPYIIATTATPIKNDFLEFRPLLHILRPGRFSLREMEMMCEYRETSKGKLKRGGVAPAYEKLFRTLTDDIIIRHKREDVAPELPTVLRNYRYIEVEDSKAREALAEEMEKYLGAYDAIENQGNSEYADAAAAKRAANTSFMRLRHLTGAAKVPYIIDYIEEFLNDGDQTRKLTIGIHHKDVAEGVLDGIEKLRDEGKIDCNEPFILRGGMNEDQRNDLVMKCTMNQGWPTNDPKDRLLLASTLAAGEGINLQKCYDFVLGERQFNPSNEEQFEGRFSRIGIDKSVSNIFGTYLTMLDTIDKWWFEYEIEAKRKGIKRTMGDKPEHGGKWLEEDDVVTDFMDIVAEQGRKFIKSVGRKKSKVRG